MSPNLEPSGGAPAPHISDLMRELAWTPGYRDADTWPTSAGAEGIVIHEMTRWPSSFAGMGFDEASCEAPKSTALTNGSVEQRRQFPSWILRYLLDTDSDRFAHGYLGVSRSLPDAHVLTCALAADARRRIEACAAPTASPTSAGTANALRIEARRFWREAASCGPFEFLVVVGFLFETWLAEHFDQLPAEFRPHWNAQRAAVGREVLCFILDQDPSNLPLVQAWLDRGSARCVDLFEHANQILHAATGLQATRRRESLIPLTRTFSGLASYGIRTPSIPARASRRSSART